MPGGEAPLNQYVRVSIYSFGTHSRNARKAQYCVQPATKTTKDHAKRGTNALAFGSAPRREADSQPISQLVSQASSQSDSRSGKQAGKREHTVWVFLVADSATSSSESNSWREKQWSNDNPPNHRPATRQFEFRTARPPPALAAPSAMTNLPLFKPF